MRTTWIEGAERRRIMSAYAERLWASRDEAATKHGSVRFGACTYVEMYSEPNEFSGGSSLLVDGTKQYCMNLSSDAMTVTLDAVSAYRILADLTSAPPVLPDSIELPAAPRREPPPPSAMRRLARVLGIAREATPPGPDVIVDPRSIARYELGRTVHEALSASGAFPDWGETCVRIVRGLVLDTSSMTLLSEAHGSTRLHPSWYSPMRSLIDARQAADPAWIAARDRAARYRAPAFDFDCM